MKRMMSFQGRHTLITGAASGIGRATALTLARRGARLSLVDIDPRGLASTAAMVRAIGGEAHETREYVVDVANAAAVEELAMSVARESGPVDVLVNNAGVAVVAPFTRTSAADWEWILGVNLWGPIRLTRALLPAMIERGSGHVVVVASLAGLVGAPGMVAYSTTKFALVGFTEALRLELADAGIGVTVVCPGFVRTNLSRATRYDNDGFRRFLDDAPSFYGLTKEEVASALADAVESGRREVVLGPEKVGWWVKRLMPGAAFALSRWAARRAGIMSTNGSTPCTSR